MTAIGSRARILGRTALIPLRRPPSEDTDSLDESAPTPEAHCSVEILALPHKAAFGALTRALAWAAFVIRPLSSFVLPRRGRAVAFELVSDEPGHIVLPFLRCELKQPLGGSASASGLGIAGPGMYSPLRTARAEELFSCCR